MEINYYYNWFAIKKDCAETLDNINDAESLGFECMKVLIDEDVILNRDFWTSLTKFSALCISANRNTQRYLSNMAKTTPRFASEIFNIWPGIFWDFINEWPFKEIINGLNNRINKLVENYQGEINCEIDLFEHAAEAYEYEVNVWKSLVELHEYYNNYFLADSLTGGGLRILSHKVFAENYRQKITENIQKKFFLKPIHPARFRAYERRIVKELAEEARLHKTTPQKELELRTQSIIIEAYGSVQSSLLELKANPSPLRAAVGKNLTNNLIGEAYWQINNDLLLDEDADVRASRRNWKEDDLINHIESKARFINLSPEDMEVFKSVFLDNKKSLSEAERQAKSRLRKKIL